MSETYVKKYFYVEYPCPCKCEAFCISCETKAKHWTEELHARKTGNWKKDGSHHFEQGDR